MNLLAGSPPLVLVDMDGVQADLATAFWAELERRFPGGPTRADADLTRFKLDTQLAPEWADAVHAVTTTPGFFSTFAPVEGAVEAMNAMLDEGWDVRICTAPLLTNPTCASDKLAWAEDVLGAGWSRRVVIAKDKTLVRGDILIDDKPVVEGDWTPTWKHVVFDATYNQTAPSPFRLTGWADWRRTLTPLLGRTAA
ncbi:5' nucleotidase, NT5C type [Cellulomonas sp. URHB0016]